ncbi:DUF3093 domain-containing protein [Mycobacterium sp. 1274756.6]|uniref:DUF3093 domain-containing protein n=1 Tax=Mycobacterium sp. 1274756.6 TaxID=1834076 RepID=UPI0007FE7A70|nr:DUF3093 domain-containing protein [Mycobacterium sp. 1274756.6]OBJ69466.1 DUF3093 domain-containing protein [Mycobacterium sp. 1274756.6]
MAFQQADDSAEPGPAPLFVEKGASWLWVLAGPAAAVAMLMIQVSSGNGYNPLVPVTFLIVVSAFLAVQVKAARIHTAVVLTEQTLRQGTETLPVADIVGVYPPAENSVRSGRKLEKWQTARALGELSGVPRGRTGIGLRLTEQRNVQAWARNHRGLRAALVALKQEYTGPGVTPYGGEDPHDETGPQL